MQSTFPPLQARFFKFQLFAFLVAFSHLTAVIASGRIRIEHLVADGALAGLPWLGSSAYQFARYAFPLWLTGLATDNQRLLFPLRGSIHTDLSVREIFGLAPGGISWPEWFNSHPLKILDFFAGFAYSTHLLEVFAIGVVLYLWRPRKFKELALAFLFANLIGITIGVIYPAAPPWFVIAKDSGIADPITVAGTGGTSRFDSLLGINYFAHFYSRNPNVFGAMPSLHSAYPVLVAWHAWNLKNGKLWIRSLLLSYAALMWFSAVYLAHHSPLDVIAGISVALVACGGVALAGRVFTPPNQLATNSG